MTARDVDRSGTVLAGQWELLRILGRGGMGAVYEAFYRADRRRYAVKILFEDQADDPVAVERFRHEFWALSQVEHPGVVGVHAFDDEHLFYSGRRSSARATTSASACGAGSTTPSADVVTSPSTPATISPPPTAPLPLQRALHDDRPRAPDAARPYLISGGIVLGASAALLGAMTAGLVQNHDAARTIDAHVAKNNSVGLSPTEIAEVEDAQRQVDPSRNLALGAGIAGGALLVTGAGLLAWGRELRRGARTALLPALGPSVAGLSLRGRF